MNSTEFLRYLRRHGATIDRRHGKGGHVMARTDAGKTPVPTHGGAKELGTGLVAKICKKLGIPKP